MQRPPFLDDPLALSLVVAGASTVACAALAFLATFWFFFAFLWAVPAAVGAQQIRAARGALPLDPAAVRPVAQRGLIAAAVTLNVVGVAASAYAVRQTRQG